jgi:predicted glycoside hydrolase/deacetylase ChbG (UPF0249 family)
LTDPKKIPSLVNENGEFKSSKEYRTAQEDFVVLDEVILEIEAQYQRFVELTGQQPHYFEGHAVASDNFFKGLEIVAERHNLRYLPLSLNAAISFRNTKLYTCVGDNSPDYDPFSLLKELAQKDYGADGCAMYVCHPGYLDAYILRTSSLTIPRVLEAEMASSEETKKWLKEHEVQVVTYDEL